MPATVSVILRLDRDYVFHHDIILSFDNSLFLIFRGGVLNSKTFRSFILKKDILYLYMTKSYIILE